MRARRSVSSTVLAIVIVVIIVVVAISAYTVLHVDVGVSC